MSKKDDYSNDRISHDKLLDLVQDYCTSKKFEHVFEVFAKEHAAVFLDNMEEAEKTDEHPIEFHEVYKKYLELFEVHIQDFIRENGYTNGDFYDACKDILDNDEVFGSRRFFIETIMAASEYTNFFLLMRAETRQYSKELSSSTRKVHK